VQYPFSLPEIGALSLGQLPASSSCHLRPVDFPLAVALMLARAVLIYHPFPAHLRDPQVNSGLCRWTTLVEESCIFTMPFMIKALLGGKPTTLTSFRNWINTGNRGVQISNEVSK